MRPLKSIFGNRSTPTLDYTTFWQWFTANASKFFKVVQAGSRVDRDFLEPLASKLELVKKEYYYVTGMYDENTAELVFTAEGKIAQIVFVEALVAAAPCIENWKFTALKPELKMEDIDIHMNDYRFNQNNLNFYANEHLAYPDEVDLVIVFDDYDEQDSETIRLGVYIFLDNYLGELKAATTIDQLQVIGIAAAEKELIPVARLKDYLNWREKEFIEKYVEAEYHSNDDTYATFEGQHASGKPLIAMMNTSLLNWESKASHPWIASIAIRYKDGNNGMPDEKAYKLINQFEKDITQELPDVQGYLNIGRQIGNGFCQMYIACREFRKPSIVLYALENKYINKFANLEVEIYKDKYWQTFEHFR